MSDAGFTTSFSVSQTPKEVFDAINNVPGWWTGQIEGRTEKVGDEFTYCYGDLHYSKQKVVESVPGRKIVWLVVDSRLTFLEDKAEWSGTRIRFEIAGHGDTTGVRFTHEGLLPDHECYGACSNAWGSLIKASLRSLIVTGKGELPVLSSSVAA